MHNEEEALPATVATLAERLVSMPGSEVILVENGSTDRSLVVARELAQKYNSDELRVAVEVSPKGLGNTLRHGISVATADRLILTAADLPFGFSDLDGALALDPTPDVVVGSKTHPASKVDTSFSRNVMSTGFRLLRRALFGLRIGDTQGSVNIDRTLGQSLLPRLESEGYFISTEVVVWAAQRGASVVEVPVDYSNPRDDSKVRPIRDSAEVLASMWDLRRRLHKRDA